MPRMLPPQPIPRRLLISPHRIIKVALIILLGLILAGGITWEILRVTASPELSVSSPPENLLTADHSVLLLGHATPESEVTVNDTPVALGKDGNFREELDLRTGLNIITITASKKFAKPRTIYRKVVVSGE